MPQLLPPPKFRAVDENGNALVGGKVYTYTSGTTTPKDSYTSYTLGAANTNPVILDSRGEASIWLDGAYKIRLRDADDNLIWEVDDVRDLTDSQTFDGATLSGTLTISGGAITWAANNTHSGNHAITGNLAVNGNTTLGNATTDTLTINPATIDWAAAATTHEGTHKYSEQPGFSAYTTVAFNVGQSNTPVDVVFGTEDYDNGACYAAGTGIFTAPVAGRYAVEFGITPNFASGSSAGTVFNALMLKNGSSLTGRATLYVQKTLAGANAQIGPTLTHRATYTLAASDTLKWQAFYSDATSIQCSGFSCGFSVRLVG